VHGCYWHHCPRCYPDLPKSNPEFWARKFELNRERDARKRADLEDADWRVVEAWECDVRDRLDSIVSEVRAPPGRHAARALARGTAGSARSTS
jgi:DNA mismatch endonuclease (patch repair protein)